ncbi:MAG: ABC transporter substrate-binding protein [Candidatus Acidiferrales bacterium]
MSLHSAKLTRRSVVALCSAAIGSTVALPQTGRAAGSDSTVTLTFTRAGPSAVLTRVFNPMLAAFEKKYPNVTVDSIPMGFEEASERFPLMAATGKLPDVALPPDSLSGVLGQEGAFLQLKGRLSEDLTKDVPQHLWEFPSASHGGSLFGVPANAGALVLWYNAGVFEKAGVDPANPPKTWDEFMRAAEAIKSKTNIHPIGLNGFARNDVCDLFCAVVASRAHQWYWDRKRGRVKVDKGNAEALDFLRSLVAMGLTEPSVESYNRADTRILLANHKVAMTFDGPWAIGALKGKAATLPADSPFRTTLMPGLNGRGATSLNISSWNIAGKTQHPKLAIQLVEFLSLPKNMLAHAEGYGVVPVRESMLRSGAFSKQPWKALGAAVLGESYPAKPGVKNLSIVAKSIPEMIQSVLLGKAKGMEALETLAKEAKEQDWAAEE